MTALTVRDEKQVARPLHVLVPLIKKDIELGNEAAQSAGVPYYRAAGEKMKEARPQMTATEFDAWTKRNFNVGRRQANEYMNLSNHPRLNSGSGASQEFRSLRDAVNQTRNNPNYGKPAAWREDINEKMQRAKSDAQRLRDETLSKKQERDAERKLALQLIDIGFKALASKLHPDKGGSRDAMGRLNRVRDRLKQHA